MGKWKLILLVAVMISSVSASTEAARWVWVAEGSHGNGAVLVNTESISGDRNGSIEAQVKFEANPPDCNSPAAKKLNICITDMINYARYFSNKSYCSLEITYYFVDGTGLRADFPCEPTRILSGSPSARIWEYLYQ